MSKRHPDNVSPAGDRGSAKKGKAISRRRFLQTSALVSAGIAAPYVWGTRKAFGKQGGGFPLPPGTTLLDPKTVPQFEVQLPDALNPAFKFAANASVGVHPLTQDVGLNGAAGQGTNLTQLYGYGEAGNSGDATYPGKTFEVDGSASRTVTWSNELPVGTPHFLPVDNTIHTAWTETGSTFSFPNEVPIATHLHGGNTAGIHDGNPELAQMIIQGQSEAFTYTEEPQEAATLWYHDHGLGITRLNVYAGLAGFNIVRDTFDTGDPNTNNPALPTYPYEQLIVIQDRMFTPDFQLYTRPIRSRRPRCSGRRSTPPRP